MGGDHDLGGRVLIQTESFWGPLGKLAEEVPGRLEAEVWSRNTPTFGHRFGLAS